MFVMTKMRGKGMAKAKNKLPFDKVKIGYADYSLNALTEKDAGRRLIDGECHLKEQEIDYDSSMSEQLIMNTILHEIGHAMVHVFGIKFKDEDYEEHFVNAYSGALVTVLRDNPELFKQFGKVFGLLEDEEE